MAALTTIGCENAVTDISGPGPDPVRCAIAFDAAPASVPAAATQLNLGVVTERDCTWTAQSNAGWIQVFPTAGQGEGTLQLTVAANTQQSPRSGSVSVNGTPYQVSQAAAGPPCSYALDPLSRNVGENGGSRSVRVTTTSGCAWSASSSVPWITFESATSGTGTATIDYRVARNTSNNARVGIITIAGQTHIVLQQGD